MKRFLIVDGNSLIHRAYHALPYLTNKKGELVNAVYGFFSILLKALKDTTPEYLAVSFDLPVPTFRHKEFKAYKAKRAPTPDDLISQIKAVKKALICSEVSILEVAGYEADDVIGSVVGLLEKQKGLKTIILSGDTDNLQLISSKTDMLLLKRGTKDVGLYNEEKVMDEYRGLLPKQLIDLKSLKGDASDNIPGVRGIGEKTALDLVSVFGSLENLYKNLEKESKKAREIKSAVKEKLFADRDRAFFSKRLVEIRKDAIDSIDLKSCIWGKESKKKMIGFLDSQGFKSLVKRVGETTPEKKSMRLF